ncbi:MAG: protein kinase [Micrococcales bacterium]|nr:protein kinase [Micrococcales bacterium]MCL2666921.1 protein kinase [Micrococcales bacterium]
MSTLLAGRYELGDCIGKGGMAEVFVANDQRLERTVAVKVLLPDSARDPSFEERFRREAKVAAALNHPAIVGVFDTGEDVSGPEGHRVSYIVMEHVAGRTVREILAEGIGRDQALEIVVGVLSALEYSHRAGIVHRDIKPANIMVTPNGAVKVMDFGIARALDSPVSGLTQSWSVVGTAQYMSPEQARGEAVDARSDVYSTGCLLFELLTGHPLFYGESMVAVAYKHIAETPPVPSSLNPRLPAVLDDVIAKALVKDRDQRYQSADEMRADLEAFLRGDPVMLGQRPPAPSPPPLPPPPVPGPSGPPSMSHYAPPPVSAAVAMAPSPASGTFHPPPVTGYQYLPADYQNQYQPADEEQTSSLGWLIGVELVVAVVALAGIVFLMIA